MTSRRSVLAILVLAVPTGGGAGELELVASAPIFERASFPSSHASTLVELDDGTLLAAWFGGTREGHPDVEIWLARREPGSERWTEPVAVADGETAGDRYPTWNPVLVAPRAAHASPGGEPLLLFYKVGPSPDRWWGMLRRSHDGGTSWDEPERLPDGFLGPIRSKPLELPDGTLLCGSSSEHDGWRVHFELTPDRGRTWRRGGPVVHERPDGLAPFSAIQPTLLRSTSAPDGPILALCRTRDGVIAETRSHDGGATWTPLRATALPNPSAGIEGLVARDARGRDVYLLVYNPTTRGPGSRARLSVAVSENGAEWREALRLEDQPGEYSYPAAIQTRDGLVHVTYTWRRERIQHAILRVEPR